MKKQLVDLADRTFATFAQAFLAVVTVGTVTGFAAVRIALVAGGYAAAKYLLVKANTYLNTPDPTQPPPAA